MPLRFEDERGNEGRIFGDLTVEYAGPMDVQGYVDQLAEETPKDAIGLDELMVRVYHELPIERVERVDGSEA